MIMCKLGVNIRAVETDTWRTTEKLQIENLM